MGKKSMETAPASAHKESRQGLPTHSLARLEDDAPRWSLSVLATMLRATGPRHGSKHLVPAETGSWGHPEPCDLPARKPHPPGCTVPGCVPWARAQALTPRGSHPCPTSPSSGEPVSPSMAVLSNQPLVPPQRRAQPTEQPPSMPRPAGTPPDPEPRAASPKISARARVLSPLQANICTRSSLEGSFPPAATSGRAHLGPPWGHPRRGFMGKAWLGVGMMGAPCPRGHARQMSYRHRFVSSRAEL